MKLVDADPYLTDDAGEHTRMRVCRCSTPRPNLDLEDERHPELRCHKCGGDMLHRYKPLTRRWVLGVIRDEAYEARRRRNG